MAKQYKGVIRLKCVDLANWASLQGLFADVTSEDPIRYSSEGMDTIFVHVQKTDTLEALLAELDEAMGAAKEKFSGMNQDFDDLMVGVKSALDNRAMQRSFFMQLSIPISPFIEVTIKETETTPATIVE